MNSGCGSSARIRTLERAHRKSIDRESPECFRERSKEGSLIELSEQEIRAKNRKSSKGNQLKWLHGDNWYKADYAGYEGLAEYVVSQLLQYSDLGHNEYVLYQTEEIRYKKQVLKGCRSRNFLPADCQLLTLERMFQNAYGESLYKMVYRIRDVAERLRFLVEMTERMTGKKNAGLYFAKMLTIDALFLNEDRHLHNVAMITDPAGGYEYCPIFDNGAALLSDTTMDYPLGGDIYEMIGEVQAKTVSSNFDEQLDAAEELYGQRLHFTFGEKQLREILDCETHYDKAVKDRVFEVIISQRRKYSYLFV